MSRVISKISLLKKLKKTSFVLSLFITFSLSATANEQSDSSIPYTPIFSSMATAQPVWGYLGMVASQEEIASRVGVNVLKRGGNAIDAAVAVGFALAVTLPRAGNIGGGGFMMIHLQEKNITTAIDYRETAPASASKDMFLDEKGEVDKNKSRYHGMAVGVPGTVAGLLLAHKNYGKLPLNLILNPAISLAEKGFPVSADLANTLDILKSKLTQWPSTEKIFYKNDGNYLPNQILKQPELAQSLKFIAKFGAEGFYKGPVAQKIVNAVNEAGGQMTLADLANYKAKERKPISGTYKGYEIISMPPPSSGGVHLIQMLNVLEHFSLEKYGHNTAQSIHILAETMKLAYADRSEYLGDPDFYPVPIKKLIDKKYAKALANSINLEKAKPSSEIKAGQLFREEGPQTTHFSVVDQWGNVVSNTYTLNFSYGSGMVAEGTGILLNNQMDDFSAKPGVPNAYGLIGNKANAIVAGKRPLSSMSPTIVLKNGVPWLATGTPGGSRIISTVLQILVNTIDYKQNIAQATAAPRMHHQWLPDEIRVEQSLNADTIALLEKKGHKVVVKQAMGSVQSVEIKDNVLFGSSDPRTSGAAAIGY